MARAITATVEKPAMHDAVFSWAYPIRGVPPEVAATEVQAIYARDRSVTPEAVVAAATPTDSPLHPAFEWDDATAAEAYRDVQAREMLRHLVVSYRRSDGSISQPTRYLVKLQARRDEDVDDDTLEAATQPHVYLPVRRVMGEDVLRRKYVREAFLSVVAWRQRYREIDEFAQLFEVIDAMGDDFGKTRLTP